MKIKTAANRIFILFILLIYLGGSCSDFVIQSSHIIYHFVAESLHQHKHFVFEHHHHHHNGEIIEHKHHHLIDNALVEIEKDDKSKKNPESPSNQSNVKFTDHISKDSFENLIIYTNNTKYTSYYRFMISEVSLEPPEHPPKQLFYI